LEKLTLNKYQAEANKTASSKGNMVYGVLGLVGEAGEVAETYKKHVRGDGELSVDKIKNELGDVMWYIAYICETLGISMQDVAEGNIKKLRARHGEIYSGIGNRTGAGEKKKRV